MVVNFYYAGATTSGVVGKNRIAPITNSRGDFKCECAVPAHRRIIGFKAGPASTGMKKQLDTI